MKENIESIKQIGDEYILANLNYLEYLIEGNSPESYNFPETVKTIIQYISPTNGLILKLIDGYYDNQETLRFGKEIKQFYPDFNGDDNESYIVLYDGNEIFYE